MQIILIGALLGDASFRHADQQETPAPGGAGASPDSTALLDTLDKAQRARVLDLQGHLLELTTGYRSGDPASAVAGEPRVAYRPGRPMAERVAAKASELQCGVRVVWKHLRRWRKQGLWGLVEGRTVRLVQPLAGVDGRIIDAILAQHMVTEADDSTGSLLRLRRRVQARLDSLHGEGVVRLPSQSTFARYVAHLLPGRHTTGLATTRQSAANQPDKVYGVITASRPGEVVMLDTSWLDALAYDPEQDTTFSVELTIAIDICTRSLLAWRLNPKGTKAVDAGLVIGDAMTPEPMRPGWPDSLRHAVLRLPVQRVLSADERFAAAAARPVIYPETIVIDHGKAFASEAVKDVCRRYGITIQDARVFRPTDKPQVEAAFRVIRSQLSEHLAGYKGYHVVHRGRDPEAVARWTLSELEEYFAEYVVAVYQRRRHDGLVVAGFPEVNLSPNDAYRLAISRAGYVACPSDPNLFLQLLPIEWRTIHHYGVDYDCLTYNGEGIRRYRNVPSPYRGRQPGKWPIRVDPRDLSQVFFHDPNSGVWHRLRWNHALSGTEPFTDIDGPAAVGKSTLVKMIARKFELQLRADEPDRFADTLDDYVPVVYLSVPDQVTPKQISIALARYLHLPTRGTKDDIDDVILKAIRRCGVQLLIIDDLHFLDCSQREGRASNDHIKYLANHAPCTLVGTGIDLEDSPLLSEGGGGERATQTAGRFAHHRLAPFTVASKDEAAEWIGVVKTLEAALVLFQHEPGSLARRHWRYLHDRTAGSIAALHNLIRLGAVRAMRSGQEALTRDLLDGIRLDYTSERRHAQLVVARAKRGQRGAPVAVGDAALGRGA